MAQLSFKGTVNVKLIKAPKAPLSWRLKNYLRRGFIKFWLGFQVAPLVSKLFGFTIFTATLEARLVKANGDVVDYGVLSHAVVTDVGVNELVDDWDDGSGNIADFNYHGSGTGAVAPAVGDTALGAEITTGLDPDNTRPTGTKSQPAANQLRSVGTASYDATAAVTEHGLFNQASTAGGILWDRSTFAAINVASGDSIQFTYTLTANSGG